MSYKQSLKLAESSNDDINMMIISSLRAIEKTNRKRARKLEKKEIKENIILR